MKIINQKSISKLTVFRENRKRFSIKNVHQIHKKISKWKMWTKQKCFTWHLIFVIIQHILCVKVKGKFIYLQSQIKIKEKHNLCDFLCVLYLFLVGKKEKKFCNEKTYLEGNESFFPKNFFSSLTKQIKEISGKMSSLIRAVSWPLMSVVPNEPIEKNGCIAHNLPNGTVPNGKIKPNSPTFQQLMAARRMICRRYYPEGGWGYIILGVGIIVNILTHGLQVSFGIYFDTICIKFKAQWEDTGKYFYFQITFPTVLKRNQISIQNAFKWKIPLLVTTKRNVFIERT